MTQIIKVTSYHFFEQPYLRKEGIKHFIWEMYEEFATEEDRDLVPRWDYYIEDENEFTTLYDEVASYLAFGDYEHYQKCENDEQFEKYMDTLCDNSDKIDDDFKQLFNEMHLFMHDNWGKLINIPLAEVW